MCPPDPDFKAPIQLPADPAERAAAMEAQRDRAVRLKDAWAAAARRQRNVARAEREARMERLKRDDAIIQQTADRVFELNRRVAALEGAIREALRQHAAGVNDWPALLAAALAPDEEAP